MFETCTINRGIYEIAVPADWNRRLIYNFGGGCTDGWYRQGPSDRRRARRLHARPRLCASPSSSLNVFGNNCQEVLGGRDDDDGQGALHRGLRRARLHASASAARGGSYQQHQIADNYPGLLDGILPGCSFPEVTLRPRSRSSPTPGCSTTTSRSSAGRGPTRRSGRSPASPTTRRRRTSRPARRRIDPTRVLPASLPADAALRPDHQPGRRALRPLRPRDQHLGSRSRHGVRAPPARQRRDPVRAEGTQRGRDHAGPVPRSQRAASAASTPTRNLVAAAHGRRPRRGARARIARGRVTNGGLGLSAHPDHRLPRLQRRRGQRRYPCPLPLVLDARTTAQGQRHARATRSCSSRTSATGSTAPSRRSCSTRSSRSTAGSPPAPGRRRAA